MIFSVALCNKNKATDESATVKQKMEIFLESLRNNPKSEDSQNAFNELVKVMSIEAAEKIKAIEIKEKQTTDIEKKKQLATERLKINEDLNKAVVEIGVMADKYHGNI